MFNGSRFSSGEFHDLFFNSGRFNEGSSVLSYLKSLGGLTFYKNYQGASSLNADYSVGSPTASFTASRSASNPATRTLSGIVTPLTTADVGRFNDSIYDTPGLLSNKRGVIIEAAGTNLLTYTDGTSASGGVWTGWTENAIWSGTATKSNVSIPELTSISGATSQRWQHTIGTSGTAYFSSPATANGTVVNGDSITVSMNLRSQTGISGLTVQYALLMYNSSGGYLGNVLGTAFSVNSSNWIKKTETLTANNASCDHVKLGIYIQDQTTSDVLDLEFALPQLEKNPYATTYIPTTTAALTRNAEVLKYETAGNRTAAEETVFVKFIPFGSFANDGTTRVLIDTETKRRVSQKEGAGTNIQGYVNANDSSSAKALTTTNILSETSYIYSIVIKHSSPFIQVYTNGVSEATYTTGDWTNPSWGTYFRVGNNLSGAQQLNGIIQSVVVFGRALSATEVSAVSTLLANSN